MSQTLNLPAVRILIGVTGHKALQVQVDPTLLTMVVCWELAVLVEVATPAEHSNPVLGLAHHEVPLGETLELEQSGELGVQAALPCPLQVPLQGGTQHFCREWEDLPQ